MMNLLTEKKQYQETFSLWAGCEVDIDDSFDLFCESDFDFIEILMLFEKDFFLNLLDSSKNRQDFGKIHEFLSWAVSQPSIEQSFVFSFHDKLAVLPFSEVDDEERDLQLQTLYTTEQ